MWQYPYRSQMRLQQHLVEVTDKRDVPLLLMSGQEAQRLFLPHRVVLVALRDVAGRMLLVRGGTEAAIPLNVWRLTAGGRVQAGEAREDAALRLLHMHVGIGAARMARRAELAACESTNFRHLTLFVAGPAVEVPVLASGFAAESLSLDREELEGLAEHFPELLSADLLWAVRGGYLFPASNAVTIA